MDCLLEDQNVAYFCHYSFHLLEMFSRWLHTAKESASQLLTAANNVIQEVVPGRRLFCRQRSLFKSLEMTVPNSCFSLTLVSERANAYIRDNILKTPEDCTYITSNIIGIL